MTAPLLNDETDFVPRVYMVQEPMRKSRSTGSPVPLFDLEPAKQFGELVTCLDWSDTKGEFDIDNIIHKLRESLVDYCDEDFILAVGNPVALAIAATIAAEVNQGYVQFLMWQKLPLPGRYRIMKCALHEQPQAYDENSENRTASDLLDDRI